MRGGFGKKPKETIKGCPNLVPYQDFNKKNPWPNPRYVLSIDIGIHNTCFRLIKKWWNGEYTVPFRGRFDLSPEGKTSDFEFFENLISILEGFGKYREKISLYLIENQMIINTDARIIEFLLVGYLRSFMEERKISGRIQVVDSHLKGNLLGAPDDAKEKKLKEWSICEAIWYTYQTKETPLFEDLVLPEYRKIVKKLLRKDYNGLDLYQYVQYSRLKKKGKKEGKFLQVREEDEYINFLPTRDVKKEDDDADVLNQDRAFDKREGFPECKKYIPCKPIQISFSKFEFSGEEDESSGDEELRIPRPNYRYQNLTAKELKEICRKKGIKVTGTKEELFSRLEKN